MSTQARGRFTGSNASVLLDLVRGLAAALVVCSHWRNLFFVDYRNLPQNLKRGFLLPYLLTSGAHRSVVLFFVLSGYFIAGSIFRSAGQGPWNWQDYALRRIVRLWIVLIPGLLLCAAWDGLGLSLHRAPLLYAGLSGNHLMGNVATARNWPTFFGNLFFLQSIHVSTFGSDTPLWSLANEFWYYALFPMGWLALRRPTQLWVRLLCGTLFLGTAYFVGRGILFGLPIWLLGALLYRLPPPSNRPWMRWLAAAVLVTTVYGLPNWGGNWNDILFGVISAVCIWVFLSDRQTARERAPLSQFSRGISRFSFTVYVVHMPLLMLLASLTVGDGRWVPSPRSVATAVAVLLSTLVYAWLIASLTEFHTDHMRQQIERLLGMRVTRPSQHQKTLPV
ncbi:acyltransferase family protein [Terriglobus roseus]|uniref:Peptidoglycan/LPS O-acetylase OafA/YrhL, contains acyltransferase and SGNH-hydrolase domains n=1 Tax=Terriglobus roseus TaxID=392734 RepID=A0A1H4S2S2_9BACT|nr:acyltransferase [Terriglobus roseus]SEC38337.1 Peptidoglycan/LPS O-acetylase OafA/YrhL, contains acyltransferase and SGNH-hydrolase domains [Terriglobus roseus]